jgi:hypothetical protein
MDLFSSLCSDGTWVGGIDMLLAWWHVLSPDDSPRISVQPVYLRGEAFVPEGAEIFWWVVKL